MTWRIQNIMIFGALAAGVWVLFSGGERAATPAAAATTGFQNTVPPNSVSKVSLGYLPQQIERDRLEPATRDPFGLAAATSAALPKPIAVATPLPPFAPPAMVVAAPAAPTLDLRFTGRMTNPDGQQLIFATLSEMPITLSVGQSLANGYRVDSITDRLVQLSHPTLGATAQLQLPEPPKYEIR